MTKKHFEAMADYVAVMRNREFYAESGEPKITAGLKADACYELAVYLCRKFGANFDQDRFDAWIKKHSKKAA